MIRSALRETLNTDIGGEIRTELLSFSAFLPRLANDIKNHYLPSRVYDA